MCGPPKQLPLDEASTPVWERNKAEVLKALGASNAKVDYYTWTIGGRGNLFSFVGTADGKPFSAAASRDAFPSEFEGASWL